MERSKGVNHYGVQRCPKLSHILALWLYEIKQDLSVLDDLQTLEHSPPLRLFPVCSAGLVAPILTSHSWSTLSEKLPEKSELVRLGIKLLEISNKTTLFVERDRMESRRMVLK